MPSFLRQSSWVVTLPLVGIAIGYLTLIWLPRHRELKVMQGQLATKRQFVAQAAPWSTSLTTLQKELDKAARLVQAWEKRSPHKQSLSSLYGQISGLAKATGLSLSRFDPQPLSTYERIEEIPLSLACSGSFAQVHEFLRGIEGLPVTIWVESLKMDKTSKDSKDIKCEVSLVMFSDNLHTSDYARRAD